MTDLVPSLSTDSRTARALWLVWLAAGARDVNWALSSLPTDRWTATPPGTQSLGTWPPARHVRHLALSETRVLVPLVDALLGGPGDDVIHVERGGSDTVNCGPGHDVVYERGSRDQTRHCEVVKNLGGPS